MRMRQMCAITEFDGFVRQEPQVPAGMTRGVDEGVQRVHDNARLLATILKALHPLSIALDRYAGWTHF